MEGILPDVYTDVVLDETEFGVMATINTVFKNDTDLKKSFKVVIVDDEKFVAFKDEFPSANVKNLDDPMLANGIVYQAKDSVDVLGNCLTIQPRFMHRVCGLQDISIVSKTA